MIVDSCFGCSQFNIADNDRRPVQHGHGHIAQAHLVIAIAGLRSAEVLLSTCHDCNCHYWFAFRL